VTKSCAVRVIRQRLLVCLAATVMLGMGGLASANFTCAGNVQYLALNSNGAVYINVGFGVWTLCGVSSDGVWGGNTITAASCRAWYAGFLAAKRSNASVTVYLQSPNVGHNDGNCTAIGSWVVPNGLYHVDFN
jgi:hypothetical protein